jgi:hypothetical protein
MKDRTGRVWLRGVLGAGSGNIATLPVGFRVPSSEILTCWADNAVIGRINLTSDGLLAANSPVSSFIPLTGLSFSTIP